jgi:hypothetical protein
MHKWVVFALGGVFAVFTSVSALARDLGAPEIRAEIIGQSLLWSSSDGSLQGSLYLDTDGSARLSLEGAIPEESGVWRLDGDQLCTQWRRARGGEEKCYFLSSQPGGIYATTGGNFFRALQSGV